jgi:hypothetical protein
MRLKFVIPGTTPLQSRVIIHYLSVFALAFAGFLSANAAGAGTLSTVSSLLISAVAAGVSAVINAVTVVIPAATLQGTDTLRLNPKIEKAGYEILSTSLVMFLSIFGAALVSGLLPHQSLPSILAVVLAAIASAVAGVVSYLFGLIPHPKAIQG